MTEAILITLCTLNLLALAGLAWFVKAKVIPFLAVSRVSGSFQGIYRTDFPVPEMPPKGTEKTVILLTPEHDERVLGDESEG